MFDAEHLSTECRNPKHRQPGASPFYAALERALEQRGKAVADVCPPDDSVALRVLHDYGAMFVGTENILPPPLCVFAGEEQVSRFQKAAGRAAATIGGDVIELQPAAMTALSESPRRRARRRAGYLSARWRRGPRRSYTDTMRLWITLPAGAGSLDQP